MGKIPPKIILSPFNLRGLNWMVVKKLGKQCRFFRAQPHGAPSMRGWNRPGRGKPKSSHCVAIVAKQVGPVVEPIPTCGGYYEQRVHQIPHFSFKASESVTTSAALIWLL